jgi:hypothetical protein
VAVQVGWPFRWSAPTLVGGPSWSLNKVGLCSETIEKNWSLAPQPLYDPLAPIFVPMNEVNPHVMQLDTIDAGYPGTAGDKGHSKR